MAYRAPPTELTKHVSRLLKGKLLKKPPTWFAAVQAVPPGPSVIRAQNTEVNIAGQTNAEKQFGQANRLPAHSINRHKQKNLKTRAPKPRPIVYPEDRLRRQFYKDHPFELQRPKLLVETTDGINRTNFSQLLLDGMHPAQVDGETVIKYQLHLMVSQNMTERQAYAKATSEFYEIRAQEEEEKRLAQSKIDSVFNALAAKKQTERTLQREEKAIAEALKSMTQ
ncbi:hypothetical protein INT43_007216 [Umbelopsis isabellina]|uniref:Small ribosomal subunit protein mS23 n=1 Tax=Mortierella isabellina TaxID=91625 RepID=A0A8H7UKK1_MORIS|nr:hypothetical protein INT43_007216 [Umbelopsis isabellina]